MGRQSSGCGCVSILLVGLLACIVLCCGGFAFLGINYQPHDVPDVVREPATPAAATEQEPAATSSSAVPVGSVGKLQVSGESFVLLADSKETFNRFLQLSTANDTTGIAELVIAGKLTEIPAGTRARVIARNLFGPVEVRVQGGEFSGESGFIDPEFIVP